MGHSWESTISHRKQGKGCPKCADEYKTSFPEQSIFFYLKQVTSAQNRHILDNRTEVDIFLPDYNIGIEYDGEFYHSGEKSQQREKRKEDKLKNLGITLVRVKETRTPPIILSSNIIFSPPHPTEKQLGETINKLISHINKLVNSKFCIDIDLSRDRNKIHEQYILNEKENSLLNTHPHLAEEWHPTKNGVLLPEHVRAGSNKKAWWLCKKGHEWDAVINSRRKGIGCPICSGRKVLPGYNDLATLLPDIAKEWHPTKNGDLKPSAVTKNSNKKVWWKCKNNHVWQATISSRNTGTGCPYCSGSKVLSGVNDFATINPILAQQWNYPKNSPLKPTEILPSSNKKVWWKCNKNHEWEASVNSRNSGKNCPYCSNQKVLSGYNDLQTTNPSLALEWHPVKNGNLKPTAVIAGSNKKAWWKCQQGHVWFSSISSRNRGAGCPYCYHDKRTKK